MGVNLEASTLMLPTTRLLLAAKRARGGRPDLVASSLRDVNDEPTVPSGRGTAVKSTARIVVWMTEEWLRQLVALGHTLRGRIVVFDRHFLTTTTTPTSRANAVAGGHSGCTDGCSSGSTRSRIS